MDLFFRQWWYDPRFKHNSSTPFTMAADPTEMFWTPDTYFFNVKKIKYHFVTRENMRVMIYSTGKIYFSARWVRKCKAVQCNKLVIAESNLHCFRNWKPYRENLVLPVHLPARRDRQGRTLEFLPFSPRAFFFCPYYFKRIKNGKGSCLEDLFFYLIQRVFFLLL